MNPVATILRKELRSYFLSPIALIFLGIFLVVNLFVFFTYAKFFARNIADIRPLFEWLPILLIFLVAAISMRAWSEEQADGTLEILMTLPVKTWTLVLGKLAAGMCLVGIALALTLPLPITVAFLGDLDMGPVIGGYVGALFLSGAYMAIGMCVSSRTDNQIVSLMITAVIGAVFYLIGSDAVVGFFGHESGELLRAIGSGSRFYNIERGVLDFRDVFYYTSITLFFVVLTIHFIDMKRIDGQHAQGRNRLAARVITVALVALNMVGGNIWLAPVTSARADLTEDGQYSVSQATEKILTNLDEPLVLAGYFSEKTHPLLSPLVPHIRDFLGEYKTIGGSNVQLIFEDPNKDEAMEEEIAQAYNIKSLPFRISDKHEESVVNSYFHILVKYGDQFEVLSFDQLIEVQADDKDIDVRLRNLEYDLTRAIKKVSSGFQTVEAMLGSLEKPAKLSFYVTPNSLPEEFKEVPENVRKAAEELAENSGGKFQYEEVNLDDKPNVKQEIAQKYGFKPMAADLFGEKRFHMHLLLQMGDKLERIYVQGNPTQASIKQTLEGAFKRVTPGFIKTIGLFTEKPEPPPRNPQMPPQMQPPAPQPDYKLLEKQLSDEFNVERVQLEDGIVPGNIDVLIVAKPGTLSDKQQFAVDQFLMTGGAVIALTGDKTISPGRQGLDATPTDSSLKDMLKTYGVTVKSDLVMDSQNARFPVPIQERKGMFVIEKVEMMDYPFFPDIRSEGFSKGHLAVSGLQNVVLNWASPIEISTDEEGVKGSVLLSSSKKSWVDASAKLLPESLESAKTDYAAPDKLEQFTLGATLKGTFKSYFADKPSPLFGNTADESGEKTGDRTGRTLKTANKEARLAVVGSSAFVSDLTATLGRQLGGNVYRSNFQFARNLIDWALADMDLLEIRTSGTFARTLKPLENDERTAWEMGNYVFVLLALGIVVVIAVTRRRKVQPIIKTEGNHEQAK